MEERKFRVGDKVRIIRVRLDSKQGFVGREGTVEEVFHSPVGAPFAIRFTDNTRGPWAYYEDELELTAPLRFSEGDAVRIKRTGIEGVVWDVDMVDKVRPYSVKVVSGDGFTHHYFVGDDDLEPVGPPVADDNARIITLINERLAKGRETYRQGVTVHDGHAWEREALEEALDAAIYLAARLIEISDKRREEAK